MLGRWNAAGARLGGLGFTVSGDGASETIREGGLQVLAWPIAQATQLELTVTRDSRVARLDVVQISGLAGESADIELFAAMTQLIIAADPGLPADGRGAILTELVQSADGSVDRDVIVGEVRYRLFTGNGEVTFYAEPVS